MIKKFHYNNSFEETPDFYFNLINPLADLNKMMMYVWGDYLHLKYLLEDNVLYNFAIFQGIPYLWGPPIGGDVQITHVVNAIRIIQEQREKKNIITNEPEILYLWQDYKLFKQLNLNNRFNLAFQAKEYIYLSLDLANLNEQKFKSKRKSRNRFINKYNPLIKYYSQDDNEDCLELIDRWEFQKHPKISKENEEKFISELAVCRGALSRNLPLEGVTLFIGNRIVGFSIGYKHTQDTFNCMFEKTDLSFPDASSYIFSELGNTLKNKYKYINAGEDWGVDYLATAKNKWFPIKTEHSYSVKMIQ
ncbi:MAG: phosphatidylglycerol lysyltransferase domain-containing protein [Ignavibacteriales bacterium]|nr:phosphatidylglycerol lysyltransferase domain-containing protein [Ignavibacteriales bacterium]MCF8315751.1 phosphatidylglycerol lysyltransferase domain-containing protein [Ignavibacteriales bacterium]MCF8437055.1 phosphatidylglycerol lysyltransferase domain-containing protein [Ignavibacteriales bacterium]